MTKGIYMGTLELKSDLHKILDKIENEQLLRTIHDFLKDAEKQDQGRIWDTLTADQKSDIYFSFAESEVDQKLIDWENLKKKY